MRIGYWCVVALYGLGLIHLFFGCFNPGVIEKARSFSYAAAMFGAASALGMLWLMDAK